MFWLTYDEYNEQEWEAIIYTVGAAAGPLGEAWIAKTAFAGLKMSSQVSQRLSYQAGEYNKITSKVNRLSAQLKFARENRGATVRLEKDLARAIQVKNWYNQNGQKYVVSARVLAELDSIKNQIGKLNMGHFMSQFRSEAEALAFLENISRWGPKMSLLEREGYRVWLKTFQKDISAFRSANAAKEAREAGAFLKSCR